MHQLHDRSILGLDSDTMLGKASANREALIDEVYKTAQMALLPKLPEVSPYGLNHASRGRWTVACRIGGAGTTHLAIAIGRSCIRSRSRGRFYGVADLVNRLVAEVRNVRRGRIADALTSMEFVGVQPGSVLLHPTTERGSQASTRRSGREARADWRKSQPAHRRISPARCCSARRP
jgi:hypothetical protein